MASVLFLLPGRHGVKADISGPYPTSWLRYATNSVGGYPLPSTPPDTCPPLERI